MAADDDQRLDNDTQDDPFLADRIEDALAPFVGILPAEALQAMRESITEVMRDDAFARQLVERARPKAAPLQSGERVKDGVFPIVFKDKKGAR